MASAAVNGSALAVSFVGNGGGGGSANSSGAVSRDDSSPEGPGVEDGEPCYYSELLEPHDDDSHHHPDKISAMDSDKEEKASFSDAKSEGGDSIKRPCSEMEAITPSYPAESSTPPLSSSPVMPTVSSFERSSKKRRKQSNPVRLATSMATRACNEATDAEGLLMDFNEDEGRNESSKASGLSAVGGDLDNNDDVEDITMSEREDFDGGVYRCPHCNVLFDVEEQLRDHIEEEHVQKALERQLQQQNQKNLYGTIISLKNSPSLHSSPYDLSASSIAFRLDGRTPDSSSSEHSAHEMKHEGKASPAMMQAHQQFGYPSTPTTTAASPLASAVSLQSPKDMASLMALSGFGNAPFLIPILPCGSASSAPTATSMSMAARSVSGMSNSMSNSGSISNSSSIPGSGPPIRIFNPEAFCELCNKEFCNKYFLKTHKANKHGIYSVEVLAGAAAAAAAATTASSLGGTQVSSYAGNLNRSLGPGGSPLGGQETSPHSGSIASACISSGCNTTSANSTSSAGASLGYSMAGSLGLNASSLLMSSMGAGKSLPVMNPDAFCDICQKEFCNKYFLRKHRQKIHGIFDPSYSSGNTSLSGLAESFLGMPPSDSGQCVNSSNPGMNASGNPVPPDMFYEYGARDLSAKIAAATQALLTKHGIQNLASTLASSPSLTITSTTSTAPNLSTISTVPPSHFTSGMSGPGQPADGMPSDGIMVAGYIFSPDRLREMGVINVDAFCEICCKEFCNKYFLRTHKMNKHGIGVSMSDALFPSLMPKGIHHQQSAPLSLVMDKEGQLEDGRKSATPSSCHSSSSRISTNGQPLGEQIRRSSTPQDITQEISSLSMDLTCDVCSRPFSSAYLLKMHKFYFHNIGDAASATGTQAGNDKPSTQERNGGDQLASKQNSSSPEILERRCGSTSSVIKLASGENSSGLEVSANAGGSSGQPINEDLQKLQTMIMDLNTSPKEGNVKCNICYREMKNKYFLRAHMMNEHGELHNEEETLSEKGGSKDASMNVDNTNDQDAGLNVSSSTSSALITSLSNCTSGQKNSSGIDPESFCEICCKEFCSKYFLRVHRMSVHGIGGHPSEGMPDSKEGLMSIPLPIPLDRIKVEGHAGLAVSSAASLSQMAFQLTSTFSMPNNSISSVVPSMSMPLTERPPLTSVTGRNFCEICNKELCNKYFMKTHMLKMHGINVEDKAGVNGATIGGVTCDICQKELCSKYFLKVHKQNTHGIFEEPTMSKENYVAAAAAAAAAAATVSNLINSYDKESTNGHYTLANNVGGGMDENMSDGSIGGGGHSGNRYFSHYTEVCPLCDRRFKSIKWLKTHVINDHADLAKENGLAEVLGADFFFGGNNASGLQDMSPLQLHSNRPHHLSPRDFMMGSEPPYGIKVEKPSSSSSSATTSPNATSPFHLHSHHQQHSHRPLPLAGNAVENDNTSGERGTSTTIHHVGELGSTGAAVAGTIEVANITNKGTLSTSSSSSTSSIGRSSVPTPAMTGPLSALRKPMGSGSGTRIYLCSYCSYSTRWLSNLYAHEKRHTGLSSEGEKRFCCRVCHRAYRYNHSLQRHLVSHKTTGILMKHVAANFSSPYLYSSSLHSQNANSVNSLNRQVSGQSLQLQQKCIEGSSTEGGVIRTPIRPKSFVNRTVAVGSNGGGLHASNNLSIKQAPARVKKYRCSKCGAKYRSREQCLEHIHMHHNTRNRNSQNQAYHPRGNNAPSPANSNISHGGTSPAAASSSTAAAPGNKTVFHCPLCPFSTNNREGLNFHLAKHQGEDQAQQQEEPDEDAPNMENEGTGEELSEQQQLQQHHLQLMQQQQNTMGRPQLPMTYAVPQTPPSAGSFIMQPFLVTQAETDSNDKAPEPNTFVPSLVYLPVSHKVNETLTVAFNLTPA